LPGSLELRRLSLTHNTRMATYPSTLRAAPKSFFLSNSLSNQTFLNISLGKESRRHVSCVKVENAGRSILHGAMSGKNGGRVIWPWKDTSLLGWYDLLFSRTSYNIMKGSRCPRGGVNWANYKFLCNNQNLWLAQLTPCA